MAKQYDPTHSDHSDFSTDPFDGSDFLLGALHKLSDISVLPQEAISAMALPTGRADASNLAQLSQIFASVIGSGNAAASADSSTAPSLFASLLGHADQVVTAPSSGDAAPSASDSVSVAAAEAVTPPATSAAAPKTVFTTVPQQDIKQFWTAADVPTDSLFAQEWHLYNTGQNGAVKGVDINVLNAWHAGFTGKGVSIGVFDTAMDVTNSDLKPNVDLSKIITGSMVADHAFVDPTKITSSAVDSHSTSVAGIIGAAKDGAGVVGIAYNAKMTPVDILGAQSGNYNWEAVQVGAKLFDVTNNSWGFTTAFSVGQLDSSSQYWVLSGLKTAADQGRHGLGTIEVLAAGNYRQNHLTTELTGPTVDRHMVVVGATDDHGTVSYYSNAGASLLVVAPSSGMSTGITTDDVTGSLGYSAGNTTNTFGGTSAASPEVAAVTALMLQANPNLGWRDVQDILAITARHTGTAIGGGTTNFESDAWTFNHASNVNGGGMHFSNDYGFGMVDAFAAAELAKTWNLVHSTAGTSVTEMSASAINNTSLDVGHAKTNVLTFNITSHESVESMVLDLSNLKIDHASNLVLTLTSPTGTTSQLLNHDGGSSATITSGWEFMSREFLGEDAYGTWKVTISDTGASDIGSLSSAKLTAYGSSLTNNSVFYFTDEFSTLANADPTRGVINYSGGCAAIDAAPVTGNTVINLLSKTGSIDGHAITIGTTTNVTTVISGDGDSTLIGNNLGNKLVSGLGNDSLTGGTGNDYLDAGLGTNMVTGGAGADQFVLHSGALDLIVDFLSGTDKFVLSKSEFSAFSAKTVNATDFLVASTNTGHVAGGGLLFDTANSTLYYDADGHSALTAIAHLNNNAKLGVSDIVLAA